MPENFVYLNALDAQRLTLADGDTVEIHADGFDSTFSLGHGETHAVRGRVKVLQGIRPASVAVSWHYGHWAYGSRPITIDGTVIKGEQARGRGLCPNPAMAVDAYLKDLCLTDPIAGDSAFGGTMIKLVKVGAGGSEVAMPATGHYSEGPRAHLVGPDDSRTASWLASHAATPRGRTPDAGTSAEAARRWQRTQRQA
jgi:hypothetical protein